MPFRWWNDANQNCDRAGHPFSRNVPVRNDVERHMLTDCKHKQKPGTMSGTLPTVEYFEFYLGRERSVPANTL